MSTVVLPIGQNNHNTTGSTTFSQEQLLSDTPPQQVNSLLWKLSSHEERQYLLTETSQPEAKTHEQQKLSQVTQQFQQRFANAAQDKTQFHDLLCKSFGDQYDQTKAESIRQKSLQGDFSWMPTIRTIDGNQLHDRSGTQQSGVAFAAFSKETNTVYLSKDLLNSDAAQVEKVLSEEVGHALDAQINSEDAKGDEGDIFSRLLHGENISSETLNLLKQENDHGVIKVDGQLIKVEYFSFSDIAKTVSKAASDTVGAVSKAASDATDAVSNAGKTISDEAHRIGKGATDALADFDKGVRDISSQLGKGIENELTHVARAINNGIDQLGRFVGDTLETLSKSQFMQILSTIGQFIPFPPIQIAVRSYNAMMAAYEVYKGIKNNNWSMMLSGAASLASGASNIGQMVGASSKFISGAAQFSKYASGAATAYKAISEHNYAAAAGLAANFFGGNSQISDSLHKAEKVVHLYDAFNRGDFLSVANISTNLLQNVTDTEDDNLLTKISHNVELASKFKDAISQGDYTTASSLLTDQFGADLNLTSNEKKNISQAAGVLQQVSQANELLNQHRYADAANFMLQTASQYSSYPEAQQYLKETAQAVQKVDDVVVAIKEGRYDDGLATAQDLFNYPLDEGTLKTLHSLENYAKEAKKIAEVPVKTMESFKELLTMMPASIQAQILSQYHMA
ncbi:MAG: hypothetical protein P8179_20385 [Candidatus Thiodiazotropha sp.]